MSTASSTSSSLPPALTRSATARCGSPTLRASSASAPGRWVPTPSESDIDDWLASLLGDERDVSLVAVGSRGRGDAATHSDFDLVLVHRGRDDVGAVAERVWYPIWDRGLRLDQSVRTVEESLAVADEDLRAMLGLLEVRYLGGER